MYDMIVFSSRKYDQEFFQKENESYKLKIRYTEFRLTLETINLAEGCKTVCCFVNDDLSEPILEKLACLGIKMIALRCAGFNNVNLSAARTMGIIVTRVPEYSPHSVAEHAVALLLSFNRKITKASNRVHDLNFSLDGLVGFDLYGKTVGIIGTGKIGSQFARIMNGFGCSILACDTEPKQDLVEKYQVKYTDLPDLLAQSDIISLHVPLTESTHHLISDSQFETMKKEVVLINTSRGALINTKALIKALKHRRIAGACLDVYEEESGIFFNDTSDTGIDDDRLARLLTFPNVLITSHQAFLTKEALSEISRMTLENISSYIQKKPVQFSL